MCEAVSCSLVWNSSFLKRKRKRRIEFQTLQHASPIPSLPFSIEKERRNGGEGRIGWRWINTRSAIPPSPLFLSFEKEKEKEKEEQPSPTTLIGKGIERVGRLFSPSKIKKMRSSARVPFFWLKKERPAVEHVAAGIHFFNLNDLRAFLFFFFFSLERRKRKEARTLSSGTSPKVKKK